MGSWGGGEGGGGCGNLQLVRADEWYSGIRNGQKYIVFIQKRQENAKRGSVFKITLHSSWDSFAFTMCHARG